MEVRVQLHAQAALTQKMRSRYPFDRRLGGRQVRSGRGVEEINSHPRAGIEPRSPYSPTRSLVATSTELSRLFVIVCVYVCMYVCLYVRMYEV
jgi:hypothetical protein